MACSKTALLPGKECSIPLEQDAWWVPASVWTGWRGKNPSPCREPNPGRPPRSVVTILTELTFTWVFFN